MIRLFLKPRRRPCSDAIRGGVFSGRAVLALIAVTLGIAAPALHAQLPTVQLTSLFPPGARAGSSVTVTAAGSELTAPVALRFSHPGISSVVTNGQFLVTVAPNAPAGLYDARFVGRFGISNPRVFAVGEQPEINEPATNQSVASAFAVALGTTINGRVAERGVDYFRFAARRGQRVLIVCQAADLDSRLEPVLMLEDSDGRELARSRRGEPLDFTASADGPYGLQLHDQRYRGGDGFFYRLTIGAGPWIDFALPPAVTTGTVSQVTLYGRGLPFASAGTARAADSLETLTLEARLEATDTAPHGGGVPAEIVLEGFELGFDLGLSSSSTGGGTKPLSLRRPSANLLQLDATTLPVALETEPNDRPEQAQRIAVPGEVAGQFFPRSDVDSFTFAAKKGEVFWLEVFSHRLGCPTDPYLVVQRIVATDKTTNLTDVLELADSDANLGGPEFNTAHRDPGGRFEVKEDGAYRLQLRDLFGSTVANPRNRYRLVVRRETPDFRLAALAVAGAPPVADRRASFLATTFLRRGETLPVRVIAFRRDGFAGDIALGVEDLPSGVAAPDARIPAGQNTVLLLLTAKEDAPAFAGPVRIVGRGRAGDNELMRTAVGGAVVWPVAEQNSEATSSRLSRDFSVGVSGAESVPVSVITSLPATREWSPTNKVPVTLEIVRRDGWTNAFKLKATGLAALDSLKEIEVSANTNQVTFEVNLAAQKVPAGENRFWLQGTVAGKWRDPVEVAAAAQAEAALKEIEKIHTEASAAAKTAAQALADATKLTGAVELKALAEKSNADAAARLKDLDAKKTVAAQTAKQTAERAKPRDVNFVVYSAPVTLRVTAPTAVAKK